MDKALSTKVVATSHLLRQLGVAVALSLLLFGVIAASIYLANKQETTSTGGSRARVAGDRAFQRQEWASAVEHYSDVLARDPYNPLAQFRKAYSLHSVFYDALDQSGPGAPPSAAHLRLAQQALDAYDQTLDHLDLRMVVYYNIACIHARLGRTEEALDAVARSVKLGMASSQFAADSDFDLIRQDARFQKLIETEQAPPQNGNGMSFGVR